MEETMKDYEEMLEESYSLMGDGVHDTDSLLAWRKAQELKDSKEIITVTVTGIVKGGVVADFDGIRAFIPVSKLSLERIDDCNPFLGKELEDKGVSDFADGEDISDYAKPSVGKLNGAGIISGFEDSTFRPKEFCTRAQTAKMLYSALFL